LKIVIDTNIIFSTLLGNKKAFKLIFSDKYEIFAPKMMLLEIFKYKEKIQKYAKKDINIFFIEITKKIRIIDEEYLPFEIKKKAYNLCKDVDLKDTSFIALSLYLDAPLLTGDKKLIKHLKSKNFDKILELSNFKESKWIK